MADPARELPWSIEEYLALEQTAETRHEYDGGHIWAMSGATDRHNRVAINLTLALAPTAFARGCGFNVSDMRVRVADDRYFYPDVVVTCDPDDRDPLVKARPCLVVEILSPSTETRDRGYKLRSYLALPSLQAYVLVDPDARVVEVFSRAADSWSFQVIEEDGHFDLPCPPARLTLDEVYAGLEFPPPA